MRQNGESVEAILNRLNTVETPKVIGVSNESLNAPVPTLPPDPHSHSYNREGAVTYAKDHASPGDYNLDYPSYDDGVHGDCTNFVSQALYEGGNISLEIPNPYRRQDMTSLVKRVGICSVTNNVGAIGMRLMHFTIL